jgi:hypothetical protein
MLASCQNCLMATSKVSNLLLYGGLILSLGLSMYAIARPQRNFEPQSKEVPNRSVATTDSSAVNVKPPKPTVVSSKDGRVFNISVPFSAPITVSEGAIAVQPPAPEPSWIKLIPLFAGLLGAIIGGGISLLVAHIAYGNAVKLAERQAADKAAIDFHNSRIAALNMLIGQIYECQGVALQFDYAQSQLLNYRANNQPITEGGKLVSTTIKDEVVLDAEKARDKWNAEFYAVTARAIESAETYGRVPEDVSSLRPHWGDWILKFRQDLLVACGTDTIAIASICNQIAFKTRDLREFEEHLLDCRMSKKPVETFERPESHALGLRSLRDRNITAADLQRRTEYIATPPAPL